MQVGKHLGSVPSLLLVLGSPPGTRGPRGGRAGDRDPQQGRCWSRILLPKTSQGASVPHPPVPISTQPVCHWSQFPPCSPNLALGQPGDPRERRCLLCPIKQRDQGGPRPPKPPRAPPFSCISPPRTSSQSRRGPRCVTGCGAGIRHPPLTLFLTALIWWGTRCGSQIPPLVIPPPPPGPAATCGGPPGPVPAVQDGEVRAGFGAVPPTAQTDGETGGADTQTPPVPCA